MHRSTFGRNAVRGGLLAVAIAGGSLATSVAVAGPLGAYQDAAAEGRIRIVRPGERITRPIAWNDGKVVVARKKIDLSFTDRRRDLLVKIRLPVDGRVTNADAQDVSTSSGTLSIKDRRTGEPRVWGGQVRDATFRLRRVESGRRGVRTDGRLKIRRLSGRGKFDGAALTLRVRGLRRGRG